MRVGVELLSNSASQCGQRNSLSEISREQAGQAFIMELKLWIEISQPLE